MYSVVSCSSKAGSDEKRQSMVLKYILLVESCDEWKVVWRKGEQGSERQE